jgi:hypothetical protein
MASRPTQRGVSRTSQTRGGDAMDAGSARDGRACWRTAKSCGPDTPTLVSSSQLRSAGDGGQQARSTGESTKQPLKPLRRESRIASAGPVCSCAFLCASLHTRPRVQRASGFPCALLIGEGGKLLVKPGRHAPRERGGLPCLFRRSKEGRSVHIRHLVRRNRDAAG